MLTVGEGLLEVILFTIFCLKWSVKERYLAKTLLAILQKFLYENN